MDKNQNSLKRKRDPSFDSLEKSKLLKLVSEHYKIIGCKKTDGTTAKKKMEEWKKIADKFNASSLRHNRDFSTLKTLWENLKRKAKLVISAETQNCKGTGGEKTNKLLVDPIIENVIGLIRPHVEAVNNEYDDNYDSNDDTAKKNNNATSNSRLEGPNSLLQPNNEEQSSSILIDWSQHNSSMLKAPVSAALREQRVAEEVVIFGNEILSETVPSSSEHPTVTTRQQSAEAVRPKNISRNRPILKRPEAEALMAAKLSTLSSATTQASEEHCIQLQIFHLKKLQEQEKLKQEKIKTELLKHKFQTKIGISWEFDEDFK